MPLATPPVLTPNSGDFSAVMQAADQLLNEGHYAEALILYDRLLLHHPGHPVVAINAAQAASQQGDHVEALRRAKGLSAIRHPDIDPGLYVDTIKARAAAVFNDSVSASDLDHAAAIIDGLIELDPGAYLRTGISVAQALGKVASMADYASRLLQIDPANWYAHFVSSQIAQQRGDTVPWLYHATRAILLRPWTTADQNRSISSIVYYLVTDILAHPECPEALKYVNELRAKVSSTVQNFSEESDRATDRFMRVALDGMDVSVLEHPLTDEPPPQPALSLFDTHGAAMTASQWQDGIQAKSPRLVFLAMADEVYLKRYGGNYLQTLLDRCDVDCAIVIGLVGQAARLKSVIEMIGVTDDRVFYAVDEFDPVYAVALYSAKECRTDCANAYYQSARFLMLDYLLASLQLPILVTDIDLHLQGSVAGVLERHAGKDIVLNRNEWSTSYTTRFTANLTLLQPSQTAQQFTRILRLFLQRALQRPQVQHFIDQTALTLANYHCRRHGLDNFGHFLNTEINNVMLNEAGMGPDIMDIARSFVFFAYYGSQGDSAVALMNATTAQS